LTDKIDKLTKESDDLNYRYDKVVKEKQELEDKFDRITDEVKKHANL
jgi:predicted nuclease with TOPRIM domain